MESFEERVVSAAVDYARGVMSRDIAEIMKSGFVTGAQAKPRDDLRNYGIYDTAVYVNAYNAGLQWHMESVEAGG